MLRLTSHTEIVAGGHTLLLFFICKCYQLSWLTSFSLATSSLSSGGWTGLLLQELLLLLPVAASSILSSSNFSSLMSGLKVILVSEAWSRVTSTRLPFLGTVAWSGLEVASCSFRLVTSFSASVALCNKETSRYVQVTGAYYIR